MNKERPALFEEHGPFSFSFAWGALSALTESAAVALHAALLEGELPAA